MEADISPRIKVPASNRIQQTFPLGSPEEKQMANICCVIKGNHRNVNISVGAVVIIKLYIIIILLIRVNVTYNGQKLLECYACASGGPHVFHTWSGFFSTTPLSYNKVSFNNNHEIKVSITTEKEMQAMTFFFC